MPCGYCGRAGCNVDTCPERLETYFGVPSDDLDDRRHAKTDRCIMCHGPHV